MCNYAAVCVFMRMYVRVGAPIRGVALERLFYLLSHRCHHDVRAGPAEAHGIQISLCVSDVEHHWGREGGEGGVGSWE